MHVCYVSAAPHFTHTASQLQSCLLQALTDFHILLPGFLLFLLLLHFFYLFLSSLSTPFSSTPPPLFFFFFTAQVFSTRQSFTRSLGEEASWLWFVFLLCRGAVQSDCRFAATASPCCIWLSFKTSAGMSVCVMCPWHTANRGCHERAGQQQRRRRKEIAVREWWREKLCEQDTEGVWKRWEYISVGPIKGALSGRWYSWDCWECWDWVFDRLSSLDIPDWLRAGAVYLTFHKRSTYVNLSLCS